MFEGLLPSSLNSSVGWSAAVEMNGMSSSASIANRLWPPKAAEKEKSLFVPDATPHDLRHTWASWHYCLHRDILALKEDGGWATMEIVARHAKKMPDAYREEIRAWWGLESGTDLARILVPSNGN